MRCDEIQEHLVEALYDDSGSSNENDELQTHLRTCSACRKELAELRQTRDYLRRWKDESPLRSVAIAGRKVPAISSFNWRYVRYAAIAAMALITLLALANTQVIWNKDGFFFSTRLFAAKATERNYYTKDETRDLLEQALDDSESRMSEINYLMVQKMLDTIEQERWMDLRLIRSSAAQNRDKTDFSITCEANS
jgi:hypothetical protein